MKIILLISFLFIFACKTQQDNDVIFAKRSPKIILKVTPKILFLKNTISNEVIERDITSNEYDYYKFYSIGDTLN